MAGLVELRGPVRPRLRGTTPTPTATASSRRRGGSARIRNHYLARAVVVPLPAPPRLAGGCGGWKDARLECGDRPRGGRSRAPGGRDAGRLQVVRGAGSSTARSASPARRAPGPSFLRHYGSAWTTDKDGILLDLLAAEITAVTGHDPGRLVRRSGRRDSGARSTSAPTCRPRPRRRPCWAGCLPTWSGRRSWRASRSSPGSRRRRATTPRRRF